MFVKYQKEGILSLPVPGGATIVLKPGVNPNIDEKDWKRIEKNPIIQKKIEAGIIIPMPSKLSSVKKAEEKKKVQEDIQNEIERGAAQDLAEYQAKEAVKIVKATYDVEVLKTWKYEEKRGTVLKTIEEQIEKILNEGTSKK
ncbi:MAG: hypothetical protein HRT90_07580 [Candidatus Margulisbacteria bacterium]|nr:hypothetical protein [Candidatus Margulisiibacteriota bacterium]